jgi:hypothetical protein
MDEKENNVIAIVVIVVVASIGVITLQSFFP